MLICMKSSLFGTVKAILKDKGKKPGKRTASERYIASHLLLCVMRAYQFCEKRKKKDGQTSNYIFKYKRVLTEVASREENRRAGRLGYSE